MTLDEQVRTFEETFRAVYLRFHVRVSPDGYQPSPESIAVLRHLAQSGPLLVSEACVHFDRSQAATSDLFMRLEKRALVKRKADPRDRRRTLVWLTEAGQEALLEADKVLSHEDLAVAMSRMTESERSALVEIMKKLADGGNDDEM